MRISGWPLVLFTFCIYCTLNCISSADDEIRLAENMRREFGKKPVTKDDKKTQLLWPELAEELLLKSTLERKKSSFLDFTKDEIPNCYFRNKWTAQRRSIKHDLFSKKYIEIPKEKGAYEEHDVQFLFFREEPKRVSMIKCSCQITTSKRVTETDTYSSSSTSSGEIEEEKKTMNTGPPSLTGVKKRESEAGPQIRHEVPRIQINQTSRQDYPETVHTFDVHTPEHEQKTSSSKPVEEFHVTNIEKPIDAVDTRNEINQENSSLLLKEEKDGISTPRSPEDQNGGFLTNLKESFKKYWPWGKSKTAEEIQDGESENDSASNEQSVSVKMEVESPQKTLRDDEGHRENKNMGISEYETATMINEKKNSRHLSLQKYRSYKQSRSTSELEESSEEPYEDKRQPQKTVRTDEILGEHLSSSQVDSRFQETNIHDSIEEHELLSKKARDIHRSSAGEEEEFKILESRTVVEKEGDMNLSTSTKVVHVIRSQVNEKKHSMNEEQNNSEPVTTKSVVDVDRMNNEHQNTISNSPSASQGIVGNLVGSLGGLLSKFRGQTKTDDSKPKENSSSEEDGEYMSERVIIVPAKIVEHYEEMKHEGNALERRPDVLQETNKIEGFYEVNAKEDSKHKQQVAMEHLNPKIQNKSSDEEDNIRPQTRALDTNYSARLNYSSFQHLNRDLEEQVKRTDSQSFSLEDEKDKLSENETVNVERIHQQDEKKENQMLLEKSLSDKHKHTESEQTLNVSVKNNVERLNKTRKKKLLDSSSTNSSSSISSSKSENEGDSIEKLNQEKEGTPEESGDEEVKGKKIQTYEDKVEEKNQQIDKIYPQYKNQIETEIEKYSMVEQKHEKIYSENIEQRDSKSDKSEPHKNADDDDYEFELEKNPLFEKTVQGHTPKFKNSESISVEGGAKLEEKVVPPLMQTELILKVEETNYKKKNNEENSGSSQSTEYKGKQVSGVDEVVKIEDDWYKQDKYTEISSLESILSKDKHKEKYVDRMREEMVSSSLTNQIVDTDLSSASNNTIETPEKLIITHINETGLNDKQEDQDKNLGKTNNQLFRRSPENNLLPPSTKKMTREKRYKYSSKIPSESICVKEGDERRPFLYLSKGHLDEKSFFVYRKTRKNEFHVVAYIILS